MVDFRHKDAFYAPFSAEAPAGEALEHYDFVDLDKARHWPKAEIGTGLDPEHVPEFKSIEKIALGLLEGRTRDIRPMGALLLAETGQRGAPGLARALDLMAHWLIERWEQFHPLDLEGDGEFFYRMEVLPGSFPTESIRKALEIAPVFEVPGFGAVSIRIFRLASGKVEPRDDEAVVPAEGLRQILAEQPKAEAALLESMVALEHAQDRLTAIQAAMAEHPDVFGMTSFTGSILADLQSMCAEASAALAFFASASPDEASCGKDGRDDPEETGQRDTPVRAVEPVSPAPAVQGPRTRVEALGLFDAIIAYYARSARSSPVPVAMIALRDLMSADFNGWVSKTARQGIDRAGLDLSDVDEGRLDEFAKADGTEDGVTATGSDTEDLARAVRLLRGRIERPALQSDDIPDDAWETLERRIAQWRSDLEEGLEAVEEAIADLTPDDGDDDDGDSEAGAAPRIGDRSAVRAALETLAVFFEKEEPSSPAPVYLRTLKGLVDANFGQIIKKLMPEGDDPKLPFS